MELLFLKETTGEYYSNIARNSYYTCFRLINKTWPVYENMADDYPNLIKVVRYNIQSKIIQRLKSLAFTPRYC